MYSRESSALLKFWTLTFNLTVLPAGLRILLNLLFLTSSLTVLPACLRILLNLLLSFPSVSFASTFARFHWCCWLGYCCCFGRPSSLLGGVAPSISATSSSVLLDPPFTSLNLPGPPGCFFLVTNLLNDVPWHLKSLAHPVCDAFKPVICSYRMKYMYAAIILLCSVALG